MEVLELLEQEVLDTKLSDDMITMLEGLGFDVGYYLMLEEVYSGTE